MSPYVSTGGLGEVVGSLPAALAANGWRSTVLLPRYGNLQGLPSKLATVWSGPVRAGRSFTVRVLEVDGLQEPRVWLVDCPELFGRDGVYGDAGGLFVDNEVRYAVLARTAVGLARETMPRFDVLHAHDWHAAPAVVWARELNPPMATVLTVHNHAYRGDFPPLRLQELGLTGPSPSFASFLECGILEADVVTTVSPEYAREIAAAGGVFAERKDPPRGIVNGLDVDQWDPATDTRLAATFDADSLERRPANRDALRAELGLATSDDALAAFQGRFAYQKGLDVLLEAAPRLLDRGLQLVLHGDGDPDLERRARALVDAHPGRVAARIGFDREFSARLLAGIDLLIMPSRFEPCGLSQLQAMRYGAIPVAHATGGLKDTIHPLGERRRRAAGSNGFWMKTLTPRALSLAVGKALRYLSQPSSWRTLQRAAMREDVSWSASAEKYVRLYAEAATAAEAREVRPAEVIFETPGPEAESPVGPEASSEPEPGFAWEGPPLAESYGQPMVHLVAQAPRMLYAYWEMPGTESLHLWLDDEDHRREVAVVRAQGEAWIPVQPGRPYAVGLEDGSGRELLSSLRVHAPADHRVEDSVPSPRLTPLGYPREGSQS